MTPFYLSYGALWLLVVFLTLVVLGLIQIVSRRQLESSSNGSSKLPTEKLTGSAAPHFSAVDLSGKVIDNEAIAGQSTALLFVSPNCSTCAPTLAELHALNARMRGNVVVLCRGDRERCKSMVAAYDLDLPVVFDHEERVSELFHVRVTPTAVLIDADGQIEKYGHPLAPAEFEKMVANDTAALARM